MGRWEPDGQARLQEAAMELFAERGYADVTVEEIARRAGLTKRSFFNHFADKREVLFAGAKDFEDSVTSYVAEAAEGLKPIDAAVLALTRAGLELAAYGEHGRVRYRLIAATTELRERDLIKMAALTAAIAEALSRRRATDRTAAFTAQAALAVFTTALDDWIEDSTADFPALMQRALADLRQAVDGS